MILKRSCFLVLGLLLLDRYVVGLVKCMSGVRAFGRFDGLTGCMHVDV
jgi:hypothetical protein